MWQNLYQNVLAPIARRLGTASSAAVASYGASVEVANAVEVVVIFAVGVMADLILSKRNREHFRVNVLLGRE